MSEKPVRLTEPPAGYAAWLTELKTRFTLPNNAPPWPDKQNKAGEPR